MLTFSLKSFERSDERLGSWRSKGNSCRARFDPNFIAARVDLTNGRVKASANCPEEKYKKYSIKRDEKMNTLIARILTVIQSVIFPAFKYSATVLSYLQICFSRLFTEKSVLRFGFMAFQGNIFGMNETGQPNIFQTSVELRAAQKPKHFNHKWKKSKKYKLKKKNIQIEKKSKK